MIMIWVEAPDLPQDFIDRLRDCEAFLIARRDIRCVHFTWPNFVDNGCCSAGEELLWHYALHNGEPRLRLADSMHDLSCASYDDLDVIFGDLSDVESPTAEARASPLSGEMQEQYALAVPAPEDLSSSAAPAAAALRSLPSDAAMGDILSSPTARDAAVAGAAGTAHQRDAAMQPATVITLVDTDSDGSTSGAAREVPDDDDSHFFGSRSVYNFDESEDDVATSHDDEDAFKLHDSCVAVLSLGQPSVTATVVGRIVGRRSRRVQKYVVTGPDGARSTVGIASVRRCNDNDDAFDADNNDTDAHVQNESASEAMELAGAIEHFDVGKMSASDIWNSILLKRNLSGGLLTRTILTDATRDHACMPLWASVCTQEKKVDAKKQQGIDFIQHFSPHHKLAWLRVKLFTIVSTNRSSYAKMKVTFNGHTSLSLATAGAPELTDDLRCRIAHLALEPVAIKMLCIIFGSRDSREKHDNKELTNPALWDQLTTTFVNSRHWQPFSSSVAEHCSCI